MINQSYCSSQLQAYALNYFVHSHVCCLNAYERNWNWDFPLNSSQVLFYPMSLFVLMRRSSLCFICYRSLLLREKWMHLVPWKKPLTLFQSRLLPFSCDTCRRWLPSQLRRIQPSFSPFPWTFCPDFSQVKANDSTGVIKTGMSSLQWFTFDDILRAVPLFLQI